MAEIPERSMWQPTMSSITEHAEQAMSFVNEMDRLRQIHREQFLDIDDHFNFDTSIDIFPYIFSGIVDENEAVSAIIKDLDSIAEKKTLGEAVYSYEYSPAINLLTSLTSRYENHFPIEGIELLKRIDMYTLNKEQFRSINFILASFNHHYELLPQSIKNHLAEIFTELDLNPMQQRYKSDIDALENFTDIFLTNLVGLGYEKKIFDFIASQRITYRPNYALALTACADKGFSKEVFEIVRDKTTYLPNYDITLAECAKQGMQEDILTIIEQAKEKPYNAYGPELFKESLIDCLSSPNDKIASRIRALLPESSLGYDIATFEMILIGLAANGYSKEMFEIAIKNKNISISAYIITAAVMKNSELIEDAYRWLKQNRNSQGSERLMEALAYAGKEKEMMNILKYSPRKNPKQIFNILDICKQKGLTTEVEQYCKSNFKISKPDPNEVVNEKKSKLSTLIREQFKILKLPTSHPLRKDLKDFVSQLSAQESQFLLLLTYNYGILHPVVTSFISKQTDMESANIWKLGS
ncbi:MAG TPA: hypothetical protein VLF89_09375, partial [Candidatus Saccharimonadales bacterium]|nr:hypothetical protein [Candidatus Saccharimonadales bacterium]